MSEVTICNLALAHLGDTATVASISPPDGSVQAQLCARFYFAARDAALEMAAWGFATRRIAMSLLQEAVCNSSPRVYPDGTPATWRYMYALPNGALNTLAVLPKDAINDYEERFEHHGLYPQGYMPVPGAPHYTPHPYATESRQDGAQVVLTDVCDAVLRYTARVSDTTRFSPLFTLALSHLLASMLAGPLIKGEAGIAASAAQIKLFEVYKAQAATSDANQGKTHVEPSVSWIGGR